MPDPTADPAELERIKNQFAHAFHQDDAATFRALLQAHPEFKTKINDPVSAFDSPLIVRVRSRAMLDVLLEAGADLNARSRWWAGGFGLLDSAEPELAAYAIQRGAQVDVHAAARLGLMDKLRELISADPTRVKAPGGDGQTPLHFASTVKIAEYLLEHGAEIDARDVDHESTAAQYMIRDRQEIARYLVQRGCQTDLLMVAALGDETLVRRHLAADPECIRMRVTDEYFPMINRKAGGTIYQWTLGWYVSPHEVARQFGHETVYQLLMQQSPPDVKFLAACWAADEAVMATLLRDNPGLVGGLPDGAKRHLALAARNNKTDAVHLMLNVGLPVDVLGQHRATPLHWAAFHGNAQMARDILRHQPPLESLDADFQSTPLGWAMHGSEHGWHCRTGDYAGTVEALLEAGAQLGARKISGSPAVLEVFRRRGLQGSSGEGEAPAEP